MNNEKLKKENENIKVQTKILEKNYLKKKDEEIPDYTKELKILKDIDNYIVYPGLGDEAGFVGSIALGKIALVQK